MKRLAAVSLALLLLLPACWLDSKNIWAIEPKLTYEEVRGFTDGLAAVQRGDIIGGKWGVVNAAGREVVPCVYDTVRLYEGSGGLIAVRLDGKWGFYDQKGRELSSRIYDDIGYVFNGLLNVERDGKTGFINASGTEVIPCIYQFRLSREAMRDGELFAVCLDYKIGFMNAAGEEVLPFQYGILTRGFSEGLAAAGQGYKMGYIDKNGQEVIPFIYDIAESFSEGFAVVQNGYVSNKQCGFIDKAGNEITPLTYDDARPFQNGFAAVRRGEKWSFVDNTGNEIAPFIYELPYDSNFNEGMAVVCRDGKYGFIDETGKEVIPCTYERADAFCDGVAAVRLPEYSYGFIDKTGREIIPFDVYFKESYYILAPWFNEGYASVQRFGKIDDGENWLAYGYIDTSGKEVVPFTYDMTKPFSEGLAWAKQDGKWGIISLEKLQKATEQGVLK